MITNFLHIIVCELYSNLMFAGVFAVTDDAALGACGLSEPSPKQATVGGLTVGDIVGDVIDVFGSDVSTKDWMKMYSIYCDAWAW